MRIACVVGARPNFMKIAPILRAFRNYSNLEPCLIHTGQHYDDALSEVFFRELGIQKPEIQLGVGSGTHAQQTAEVMVAIENILIEAKENNRPFGLLLVVGDVNSTLAASLAASKLQIPIAHVEAGLRSFDRQMPEELNRIMTDAISDLLFVSEPTGVENLLREGRPKERIHLVGNVMIDTLFQQVETARKSDILGRLELEPQAYGVVTLHRPTNVDNRKTLSGLIGVLDEVAEKLPLVFPVHPRTASQLEKVGTENSRIKFLDPLSYNEFLCLTSQARVIVTDSGGLQEESTALKVPCLTMRENTERPITIHEGTNSLIGSDPDKLMRLLGDVISGNYKDGVCPDLWDGNAAERIAAIVAKLDDGEN